MATVINPNAYEIPCFLCEREKRATLAQPLHFRNFIKVFKEFSSFPFAMKCELIPEVDSMKSLLRRTCTRCGYTIEMMVEL